MYVIKKETAKKKILKFLADDKKDELHLFSYEYEEDEEANDFGDEYFSIVKKGFFDIYDEDLESYYCDKIDEIEEITDEHIKHFESIILLKVFKFDEEYILTMDDLVGVKGKTLNHKIANRIASMLQGVLECRYGIEI